MMMVVLMMMGKSGTAARRESENGETLHSENLVSLVISPPSSSHANYNFSSSSLSLSLSIILLDSLCCVCPKLCQPFTQVRECRLWLLLQRQEAAPPPLPTPLHHKSSTKKSIPACHRTQHCVCSDVLCLSSSRTTFLLSVSLPHSLRSLDS